MFEIGENMWNLEIRQDCPYIATTKLRSMLTQNSYPT